MHKDDASFVLKGVHSEVIRQWVEHKTVQMYSVGSGKWEDLNDQRNIYFYADQKYRIKPEPVFKEVAIFRTQQLNLYSVLKDDADTGVPPSWQRISDWVKVEIKDDIS